MRVRRFVGTVVICAASGVIAVSAAAAHAGTSSVRGHVADGPPCGHHGPNDCRFDSWGFLNHGGKGGNCGSWYSNVYGVGDVTCVTKYLHGPGGFVGEASFRWNPRPSGGIDITLTVHGRQEVLKGITPSRGSATLISCVRAPEWGHGANVAWASREQGTPGSFDGPLYIDIQSRHSGRQDPGDQYEFHIFGWLHRAPHPGAQCPS